MTGVDPAARPARAQAPVPGSRLKAAAGQLRAGMRPPARTNRAYARKLKE
jgi:hypothetical protein